jgi:pimeloyl-ACP methyl ester carboxylesterase
MKKLLIDLFTRAWAKTDVATKVQIPTHEITPTEILIEKPVAVTSPAPKKYTYSPEKPKTLYFQQDGDARKIAYTISGDRNAEKNLLCLPGLLETKNSFALVHDYFLSVERCEVISVDFSGRGQSDSIDNQDEYKMSLYLNDLTHFINENILAAKGSQKKITVLGTSMGGVLAMYLTQHHGKAIDGIILNDIALTVNWTALYSLYKSMKNQTGFKGIRELASDLRVDEQVISDVQQPSHFDLPYKADVWGMNFHEALEGYRGKIALIYGDQSKICTKQRVLEAKAHIPRLETYAVAGAGHPAPLNEAVCHFIQSQMGLRQ